MTIGFGLIEYLNSIHDHQRVEGYVQVCRRITSQSVYALAYGFTAP